MGFPRDRESGGDEREIPMAGFRVLAPGSEDARWALAAAALLLFGLLVLATVWGRVLYKLFLAVNIELSAGVRGFLGFATLMRSELLWLGPALLVAVLGRYLGLPIPVRGGAGALVLWRTLAAGSGVAMGAFSCFGVPALGAAGLGWFLRAEGTEVDRSVLAELGCLVAGAWLATLLWGLGASGPLAHLRSSVS